MKYLSFISLDCLLSSTSFITLAEDKLKILLLILVLLQQMLLGRYVCQSCRNFARVGLLDTRANQYLVSSSILPSRLQQGECNSQQVLFFSVVFVCCSALS